MDLVLKLRELRDLRGLSQKDVARLSGVGEKTTRKLVDAGFTTREALAAATVEDISQVPGIGEKTAEKILTAARGEQTESADV